MPQKILVVEDAPDIRKLETFVLQSEGYEILSTDNGDDAIRLAVSEQPDLIILDIIIPGPDGMEVCRRIRESKMFMPILFVTARKEQWEQIAGLAIGADQYIVKPFSPAYLIAQVRAALRRETVYRADSDTDSQIFTLEDVRIDFPAKRAVRADEELRLTPGEWIVLEALVENQGRVLSREQLQERLWNVVTDEGISSRTVDMHISRLRQKLGDQAGDKIVTSRNFGYRLEKS